ncbi:MAG TPA: alkaline phosphatase family protein, partial [Methylomirabilota bacterium]|nr:alkaline phosphatase family protein [Methylomirabilota bacterium]
TLRKYQIPGPRVIPPQGFMVIYEDVLTNAETALVPFALGARGDEVVLSVASNNVLTGFRTVVEFGPAARGVSFGRHVTSDGRVEFVALEARTFGADDPGSVEEFRTGRGASNAPPRVGPVVISEIMYHPPDLGALDNARDEFIELRNVTTAPVALFEQGHGWRLRDGVDFDFRAGTVLPPGGELLVVGFDPANDPEALAGFRARYNLPASTVVVGPWSGRLANDSDEIELRRPEVTEGAEEPAYILVERVRYADASPWPPQADGTGYSIQRRAEKAFANDPTNWVADVPNPGPASAQTDSDGDGLPNAWEIEHGLDPFNPADVGLDPDGDGLSNGQEYQTGTDPRDPTSGLWLSVTRGVAEELVLSFSAAANLGYVVEAAESLAGPWRLLRSFAAESTNRVVSFGVPANGARRFFRLRLAGAQAPGTVDYVVHISLDGLGATYLERYVAEAPGAFPTFARLMREGAYTFNARCDYDISETIPNHATMLTGRPVMQPVGYPDTTHHGYNNNFPGAADTFHTHGNPAVPYKASLFDVAHDHGLATAFYASKTRLAICDRSYDDFNGGLDLIGLDDGRDKIDFASVADLSGAAISNEVNRVLADLSGPGPRNYSFIHLAEPDLTGHAVGWGTPGWSNAVRLVDAELGRILDAITGNPILADRTAVIVTADHGGGGVNPRGHTEAYHVTNYTIPFFVWGPGIPGGQNLYLLLNNRADPGTNRVEPHVLPQPLRAGDSGNLGLSLLGLPPIPGSFHVPEFAPGNGPLRVNSITALGGGQVQLEISVPANKGCTILSAPTPTGPTWTAVASYPAVSSNRVMRVTVAQNGANGFYRLRTP